MDIRIALLIIVVLSVLPLSLIWSFRMGRFVLQRIATQRTSSIAILLVLILFAIGMIWTDFGFLALMCLGIGFFVSTLFRPIFILGKDKFSVNWVEALECLLCFLWIGFQLCVLCSAVQ